MDPVIISAAEFETKPLRDSLENLKIDAAFACTGIGALHAARRSSELQSFCKGRDIFFVGTCGTYGNDSIPSLCTGRSVSWHPLAERKGLAYRVPNTDAPIHLDLPNLAEAKLPLRHIVCDSTISLDVCISGIRQPEATVENLELYSVAHAFQEARTCTVVLGITNRIGSDAHEQWVKHKRNAAEMSARFVVELIQEAL